MRVELAALSKAEERESVAERVPVTVGTQVVPVVMVAGTTKEAAEEAEVLAVLVALPAALVAQVA